MLFEPTELFWKKQPEKDKNRCSMTFLWDYILLYKHYFIQVFLGLLLGCLLQLIMPFLTQGIVDLGIKYHDVELIWLILLGELYSPMVIASYIYAYQYFSCLRFFY